MQNIDSKNEKVEQCLLDINWKSVFGDNFSPLCMYSWITEQALQILILWLQINFSEELKNGTYQ